MAEHSTITVKDGSFQAYRAEPAGDGPIPAIIVVQEIFGVNAGIRAKADRWANEGYLALAPDLFWRQGAGIELDADQPDQFQRALGLMQQSNLDEAVGDIEATIRAARAHPRSNGRVGLVGFCWGGLLAYLAAARTDVNASVGYYGVNIDTYLREAHAIANPLMLHIAGKDGFVPPEKQAAVHAALDPNPHVTIHDYPEQDHAFAREFGAKRHPEAAELADGRTRAFFAQHLS
ncbi:MAG: dienelactone hydrolase family protein [Sphingomonadaceae bacterium]|nr:dienelactone hydrolase family protein [Sphingomonadaceae bacterium]